MEKWWKQASDIAANFRGTCLPRNDRIHPIICLLFRNLYRCFISIDRADHRVECRFYGWFRGYEKRPRRIREGTVEKKISIKIRGEGINGKSRDKVVAAAASFSQKRPECLCSELRLTFRGIGGSIVGSVRGRDTPQKRFSRNGRPCLEQ